TGYRPTHKGLRRKISEDIGGRNTFENRDICQDRCGLYLASQHQINKLFQSRGMASCFSALQVVFLFFSTVFSLQQKQGNVLIRALICGQMKPAWVAGAFPH
ncbi:MAG: hypothetical protein JXR80_07090, partial [Deltaproteobacteria bacterium]|nr:hypothetical protein [Deltaproteobacteria bacterium]